MRKRFFTIALICVVIAACSAVSLGAANIVLFNNYNVQPELWTPVIEAYKIVNPDVNIEIHHHASPDGYFEALTTLIATGLAPDIFYIGDGQVTTYNERGDLADLDSLFARTGVELELIPIVRDMASPDGALRFMPTEWGSWSLNYHRGLFDQSAMAYPDDSWTWTDFAVAAQRLTRYQGEHPVVQGTKSMWWWWWGSWIQLLWQAGGEIISEDGTEAFPDLDALTQAFDFAQALTHRYEATPEIADAHLSNGSRAMDWDLTGSLFNIASVMEPEDWGIAPFPRGDGPRQAGRSTDIVT